LKSSFIRARRCCTEADHAKRIIGIESDWERGTGNGGARMLEGEKASVRMLKESILGSERGRGMEES